ncbi:MAG: SCO family protein [Acidobacteriota bacterium]
MKKAKGKRQKEKVENRTVAQTEVCRFGFAWPRAFVTPALNFFLLPFSFCLLSCLPVFAQGWATKPPPLSSEDPSAGKVRLLEDVGIDQRLGEQLPLDLVFRDESGSPIRLGDCFGKKPVVLALVYYNCPMLCNQVLNGLTSALGVVSFDIGKEFEVVTVSFDPRETSEMARNKKQTYIDWYKRPGAAEGWHFLTGDKASIDKLTEAVGFHYKFDQSTDQFVHASGIMIATPEGKLARYFYGIEYAPKDLRLGLVEASDNKIGNPVDRLLLYCFHYDPAAGKYGAVVMNILRLAGVVTLAGVVAMLWLLRRRRPLEQPASVGGMI